MNVLDGRDARGDHLEGRIERVEIEVEVARDEARREPEFERHVGRAELDRRQADVMVAVDEAGQQRLGTIADNRNVGIGGAQLGERAYRDNRSVPLKHRAVVDLLATMAIERPCDDMLAANDRRRHRLPPCPDEMSNPSAAFRQRRVRAYILEFCR